LILVDSSAWISFLKPEPSQVDKKIESIILGGNEACLCGIIFQEVLQGVRNDSEYALLKERLEAFPFIQIDRNTHLLASNVYRQTRKKGGAVPSTDALIAATAIENNLSLLTLDKHFTLIAKIYKGLKLI
jgi:predicted nucleic acid-binding protein